MSLSEGIDGDRMGMLLHELMVYVDESERNVCSG
jgi:hypothetical protein